MTAEVEHARLARDVLDSVLVELGSGPVAGNERFSEEVGPGRTSLHLDSPPLRFHLGYEFEVALGPVAEIYTIVPADATAAQLSEDLARILTSPIRVDQRRRDVTVEFLDAYGSPWLRSRHRSVLGSYEPNEPLQDRYYPAFSPSSEVP